jgi:hypothetical protein
MIFVLDFQLKECQMPMELQRHKKKKTLYIYIQHRLLGNLNND